MTNDELAVFVRREIHLAANGVTEDERIEMNPIPKSETWMIALLAWFG